jgi:hypothetical protein
VKKESMVYLSNGQAAMVYRMAGEEPSEELAAHHPMPCLALTDRFSYAQAVDPEGAEEMRKRCGYGADGDGLTTPFPLGFILAKLAHTTREMYRMPKTEGKK